MEKEASENLELDRARAKVNRQGQANHQGQANRNLQMITSPGISFITVNMT